LGSASVNASSGIASFSLPALSAGTVYLKVLGTGLPAICSQAITLVPASTGLASLSILQLPTLLKTNQSLFPAIKVEELDNNGVLVSGGTDPIQVLTYDDDSCINLSANQLTGGTSSAVSGYATFSTLQTGQARTLYVKAIAGLHSSTCSTALVITGASTSCDSNNHLLNGSCVPNTQSCVIANGIGTQSWTGTAFESCALVSCNANFDSINGACYASCLTSQHHNSTTESCEANVTDCSSTIANSSTATKTWNSATSMYGACEVGTCSNTYHVDVASNSCDSNTEACSAGNGTGQAPWNGTTYGTCAILQCNQNFDFIDSACYASCSDSEHRNFTSDSCDANSIDCTSSIANATSASVNWDGTEYGSCLVASCSTDYTVSGNACVSLYQNLALNAVNTTTAVGYTTQLSTTGGKPTITWATSGNGTISPSGLFTASSAGTPTITATDARGQIQTVSLTVNPADGTLDTTFNSTGYNQVDLEAAFGLTSGVSVYGFDVNSTTGQMYIMTYAYNSTTSSYYSLILKLTNQGSVDTTFGTNGYITITGMVGSKIKVASNGDILFAGYYSQSSPYYTNFYRFDSTGKSVSTFGTNGIIKFQYSSSNTYQTIVKQIKIDNSGNIYLIMTDYAGTYNEIRLVSLSSTGSINYNTVVQGASSIDTTNIGLDIDSGGRSVVSTNVLTGSPYSSNISVFNSSGVLDPTFNGGALKNFAQPSPSALGFSGVKWDLDGSLTAYGQKYSTSPYSGLLMRIKSDGSGLDSSFQTAGLELGTFGVPSSSTTPAIGIMDSVGNKFLTLSGSDYLQYSGTLSSPLSLMRSNYDGSVDTLFNGGVAINVLTNPYFTITNMTPVDLVNTIDGKIYYGGSYYSSTNSKYYFLIEF
jgi:hypothetical protein